VIDEAAPFDINNTGRIVGTAYRDPATGVAFGFQLRAGANGRITPVDFPGAATTIVSGINDNGTIVGAYQNPDTGSDTR